MATPKLVARDDGVSLTVFVDFVTKTGPAKVTEVRDWKHRGEYDPKTDFYKALRERIVEMHANGKEPAFLKQMQITDTKKRAIYPSLISGYTKWLGRKALAYFNLQVRLWKHGDFRVRVNPELGLNINGQDHLVKLYFKADKLAKRTVDVITHLMHLAYAKTPQADYTMSVLDVRNSRLISPSVPVKDLTVVLKGEAAHWLELWDLV